MNVKIIGESGPMKAYIAGSSDPMNVKIISNIVGSSDPMNVKIIGESGPMKAYIAGSSDPMNVKIIGESEQKNNNWITRSNGSQDSHSSG